MIPRDVRREQGSALLVTIMMLLLMGGLTLASLETVTRDNQVAGFQNRSTAAFYAAEAGASEARSLVRAVGDRGDVPAFHTEGAPATLGDSSTYSYGTPAYFGDPDVGAPPIRYVRDGSVWANGGNLQTGRQQLVKTLWQINVVGQAPGGSVSRIEVMETKVLSRGY